MLAKNLAPLTFPLALVAFASLDCGGKMDGLPACPADGTCSSDCKQTFSDCSGTYDLTCTCDTTGHAQCPELGAPNCQPDCDALMQGTMTCSIEGERCMSPTQLACVDGPTLYCTCESGQFVCDAPNTPTCPPPPDACPPSDQVEPGAPCMTGAGTCTSTVWVTDCNGNSVGYYQDCSCNSQGYFECISPPVPLCPVDAGPADALVKSD